MMLQRPTLTWLVFSQTSNTLYWFINLHVHHYNFFLTITLHNYELIRISMYLVVHAFVIDESFDVFGLRNKLV